MGKIARQTSASKDSPFLREGKFRDVTCYSPTLFVSNVRFGPPQPDYKPAGHGGPLPFGIKLAHSEEDDDAEASAAGGAEQESSAKSMTPQWAAGGYKNLPRSVVQELLMADTPRTPPLVRAPGGGNRAVPMLELLYPRTADDTPWWKQAEKAFGMQTPTPIHDTKLAEKEAQAESEKEESDQGQSSFEETSEEFFDLDEEPQTPDQD